MLVANGSDIAERIGKKFGLLPILGSRYVCKFHRSQLTEAEIDQRSREVYLRGLQSRPELLAANPVTFQPPQMPIFDCETRGYWPDDVPWQTVCEAGFPHVALPDGRTVVCVPTDPELRPSTIRGIHWDAIVAAAMDARGKLVKHPYGESLVRLQTWAREGRKSRELYDLRNSLSGQPVSDGQYPFDVPLDFDLISWISRWDDRLWNKPETKFTPSREAREILSRLLQVRPETLKTWMYRA